MQRFNDDPAQFSLVPDDAQPVRGAWLIVAILAFLYGVSLIDRMILALIARPLRADLAISGVQFSLLFGASFVLVYAIAGVAAATLADRGDRRTLLVAGVVFWSATTFASGFAKSFGVLLLLRGGLAIGESVLTPVAVSLIADLFPRDRNTLPTSVYIMSGAVIGGAGMIFGGGAMALAQLVHGAVGLAAWRLTMMIVALPGFLGAIAFLALTREPVRRNDARLRNDSPSFRELFAHLGSRSALYTGMFVGIAAMATTAYGLIAWGPTLLGQQFGLGLARAGVFYGGASAIGVVISLLVAPSVVAALVRSWGIAGLVYGGGAAALLGMPVVAVTIASGNFPLTLLGIAVCAAIMAPAAILPLNLIQLVTPSRMQARATALYLLLFGLAGQALGPLLVDACAEHVFRGLPGSLAHAIGLTAAFSAIAAAALFALALIARNPPTGDKTTMSSATPSRGRHDAI